MNEGIDFNNIGDITMGAHYTPIYNKYHRIYYNNDFIG
jgi:hypothetical protein